MAPIEMLSCAVPNIKHTRKSTLPKNSFLFTFDKGITTLISYSSRILCALKVLVHDSNSWSHLLPRMHECVVIRTSWAKHAEVELMHSNQHEWDCRDEKPETGFWNKMVERMCGGSKANIHIALPVPSFLVKNKVLPTGRQLNMSPALLILYFSIIFRALQRLAFPIKSLTAMK